ncbi:hypothetical protein LTR27_002759 [Elasticomyces elasticus]|nr:hypothetical protein LTR27_002759 [Elasticomyces elasticus]
MEESPLWKLPVELRLNIYELVLHTSTISVHLGSQASKVYACIWDSHQENILPAGGGTLHLLRLCKQINSEIGSLFFSCNKFEILGEDPDSEISDGPEKILSALHAFIAIGPTNMKALNDVTFFIASVTANALQREETRPILVEIFRRLQVVQSQRPYWTLKVSMNCCMFPADSSTYKEDEGPFVYRPAIDLKQPQASLVHAITGLETMRESKGLSPAGVRTFTDFFRELGVEIARPLPLSTGAGWFLPVHDAITW